MESKETDSSSSGMCTTPPRAVPPSSSSTITTPSPLGQKKVSSAFLREELLEEVPLSMLTMARKLPTLHTLNQTPITNNTSKQVLHRVMSMRREEKTGQDGHTESNPDDTAKKNDGNKGKEKEKDKKRKSSPKRPTEELPSSPTKLAITSSLPIMELDEEQIKEDARRLVQSLIQQNAAKRVAAAAVNDGNRPQLLVPVTIDEEPEWKPQFNIKLTTAPVISSLRDERDNDNTSLNGDSIGSDSKKIVVHRKAPPVPQPTESSHDDEINSEHKPSIIDSADPVTPKASAVHSKDDITPISPITPLTPKEINDNTMSPLPSTASALSPTSQLFTLSPSPTKDSTRNSRPGMFDEDDQDRRRNSFKLKTQSSYAILESASSSHVNSTNDVPNVNSTSSTPVTSALPLNNAARVLQPSTTQSAPKPTTLPRRSTWTTTSAETQSKGLQMPNLKHVEPQTKPTTNDQPGMHLPMLNHVQAPQNSSLNYDPREFERTVNFYFKLNADRGDANAQYYIAYCYLHGIAVEKSRSLAIKFYQLAAKQGHSESMVALKYLEEKGDGSEDYSGLKTPRVLQRAMAAHTANQQQDPSSTPVASNESSEKPGQADAGSLYSNIRQKLRKRSDNVPVNEETHSLQQQDHHRSISASRSSSDDGENNNNITTTSEKKGMPSLRINTSASLPPTASRNHHSSTLAANNSGSNKEGIASSDYKHKSTEQEETSTLPSCSSTSVDDTANPTKKFIKLNADNGDAHAQFFIAYCYLHGISVPVNKEEALKYYRLAAKQGHSGAIDALKKLFEIDMMTMGRDADNGGDRGKENSEHQQLINGMKSMNFEENAQLVRTLSRNSLRFQSRSLSNNNILTNSATSNVPSHSNSTANLPAMLAKAKSSNSVELVSSSLPLLQDAPENAEWMKKRFDEEKKKIEQELHHYQVSNRIIKQKRMSINSSSMLIPKVKRNSFRLDMEDVAAAIQQIASQEEKELGTGSDTPREFGSRSKEIEIQNIVCPPTHGEKTLRNKKNSRRHLRQSSHVPNSSSSVVSAGSGVSMIDSVDNDDESHSVVDYQSQPSSQDKKDVIVNHEYKLAADNGDANAQYVLGHCYQHGISVQVDLQEAIRYYELATNQGHTLATNALGICYQNGCGVLQDHRKAIHYFQIAAVNHHAEAEYALAEYFFEGLVIKRDLELAQSLFQLAADQGFALAQFRVANMLLMNANENGSSLDEQNNVQRGSQNRTKSKEKEREAVHYYQLAANQGLDLAQNSLGYCYQYGIGVTKNESEALKYYILAATEGNVDGQYNLGYCYDHGVGTAVNHQKALECYQIAAQHGHSGAQYILGVCCHKGIGLEQNDEQAIKYFEQAAAQGHSHALCALGICYQYGFGTSIHVVTALTYYRLAMTEGDNTDAKQFYDELMAIETNGGAGNLNGEGQMSGMQPLNAGSHGNMNALNDSWSSLDDELSVISDITFLEDDGGYTSN